MRTRGPDFIVLGAMRSGTTSMWRYLTEHPDIYMTPKELGYFTDHLDRGRDWYLRQYERAGDHQIAGEATADYLARPPALDAIAAQFPEVRLVAMLRNPIDRAWSHYWLLRERGRETRSFDAVLDHEMALATDVERWAEEFTYLRHGTYDEHLESVLARFDRTQLQVVITEDMVAAPEREFASVCSFVGADASTLPSIVGDRVNAYVSFRSRWIRDRAKHLPAPLANAIGRVNTVRNAGYPELGGRQRAALRDFYSPHVERVEALLGQRITAWQDPAELSD